MTSSKREEKALLEFKQIMKDVVRLLRASIQAEAVYHYWVNRKREQFVLETSSATRSDVMFQDRTGFEQLFLSPYRDIESVRQLKVGVEIEQKQLRHYSGSVPVKVLTLIPFVNHGETVSITVIETEKEFRVSEYEEEISAYRNSLINILNTYLELNDLYEDQQEWVEYEASLNRFSPRPHKVEILDTMVEEMQKQLPNGGVTVVARGMDCWVTVLRSSQAPDATTLGMIAEEKSMTYEALQKGEVGFSIHFNQNPKRVATAEVNTEGATLAIPLMISDRRHLVVLAYHPNPLLFKETTKHQLINLARTAWLSIQVNLGKLPLHQDLLTSEYGSFIPDLWEKSLKKQILRAEWSVERTWFGLIAIENVPALRSRLRLEDLKKLQRILVNRLNPAKLGFHGTIGFNSDYLFSYLLICENDNIHQEWKRAIQQVLDRGIELNAGQHIDIDVATGSVVVDSSEMEAHEIVQLAKRDLYGRGQQPDSRSMMNL